MKSVQRVLIVGGGIVGLTAGIALRRSGAEVILYERAPEIRAAGASLGLWQNALRAFDAAGVGDAVRGIGRQAEMVFHDPSARLLTTPEFGPEDHSYLLVSRSHLTDLLADTLGRERIRLGCPVTGFVEESDQVAVRLADGSTEAGDLLLGADGVHSTVRAQLVPGAAAQEHAGHVAWRAVLPAAPEGIEGDVLVIGHQRCRGGYLKSPEGGAFWLLAQFQSPPVTGNHREECLQRAGNLDDGGWNSVLTKLITATPEDRILFNQILIVPELDKWVSGRVALVGDAAHGMSPHITAGASLGVQDPLALVACLDAQTDLSAALAAYEAERIPHYRRARQLSEAVEAYRTPSEFAHAYAAFSHWMIGH